MTLTCDDSSASRRLARAIARARRRRARAREMSSLNPSASSFVFAPRASERALARASSRELGALGVVSDDEDERARALGGLVANDGNDRFAGDDAWDPAHVEGDFATTSEGDFDDALAFLQSAFADMDVACLEEALMNTGGDVELAMELLLDDEVPTAQVPDVDDAEAFPTLGGSKASPAARGEPEELPKKIFLSGGMSNVNRASAASTWNAKVTTNSVANSNRTNKIERGVSEGTQTKIEWVETGAAVSQMYAANREEARDYARVRNVCYEQATNAFLSGNKALAKELSRQGREAAAKMSAAHEVAATSIYHSRGGGKDGVIDLHGLHVAEAISILRRELSRLRSSGHSHAQVLVGTGHHTVGSRTPSRLPVAVETFLQEQRLGFSEPQSGLLQVRLN